MSHLGTSSVLKMTGRAIVKHHWQMWLSWVDVMLKWKPEDYGELTKVRVPVTKIWKPDIVLYNFADERLKEHREAMAVVQHNGEVLWLPAAIFKSTCSIDIVYFPFDIQKCQLKFGSWTYDGFELDLNLPDDANGLIDLTDYLESNEWKILGHPGRKNKKFYTCCNQPYYDLTFSIIMKRIPFAHVFNLIIPCVLLSVLTLVSFWLPPETPAKILLGMNLFLAFFLLLKILSVSTPASKSIPLIGAYFCLNMVLITLSSFISVAVINLYKRDDKRNKVPKWLKKVVIEGLSRILCMEQRKNIVKKPRRNHVTHHVTHVIDGTADGRKSHHEKTIKSPVLPYNKWEPPSPVSTQQAVGRPDSPIVNHPLPSLCIMSTSNTDEQSQPPFIPIHPPPFVAGYQSSIESEVKEVKKVLRNFMSRLQVRETKEKNAMEWRLVALVIDRVFFILYIITVIVSTVTVYIMCFMYYESTEHIEAPSKKEEGL